ncbi:MAG TPA: Nramp family divalent metal transporter [Flavobacteriaceae bacterium]|nr:Nramp family divalent metal transporter [Flavobacteriaceae bacterium]
MMKNIFKHIGPGTFVAAAFIGPGTVTVCTLAGVQFGFTLLWAMVLSIVATLVLQEMAARLGLVYGKGLAEAVKTEIRTPIFKIIAIILILSAIIVGNAAYEAGNISGAMLGLDSFIVENSIVISEFEINYLSFIIGAIAFAFLYIGNYKVMERLLIGLVILMSLSFLVTAIITKPDYGAILKAIFIPKLPKEGLFMVLGLVGTTVVPYNLFLHASLVKEKWKGVEELPIAKKDALVSIVLGGLVSLAIIISAAAVGNIAITDVGGLAKGLEPLYGSYARYFLSIGLFAAGITSSITAPLAASYVARDSFGWEGGLKSRKFRSVWMTILILGILFSSVGFKPIEVIQFAQVANGLLLPVLAGFLLWVVNRKSVLGVYKNSKLQNVLGLIIFITTIILGVFSLLKVFGLW